MKKNIPIRTIFFSICLASLMVLAALSLKPPSKLSAQIDNLPTIENETEALAVEGLTSEGTDSQLGILRYALKLKNVSTKKIIVFSIEQPNGGLINVDYTIGSGALLPGSITRVDISDYSFSQGAQIAATNKKKIAIRYVMFEGGSSEGDFKVHERISNKLSGRKTQLAKINAILGKGASRSEDLAQLASEISALPETGSFGESSAVSEGLIEAKQLILRRVNSLREWDDASKRDLNEARNILRKSNAELLGISNANEGLRRIIDSNQKLIERSGKQ